jgi:hypothetical protein
MAKLQSWAYCSAYNRNMTTSTLSPTRLSTSIPVQLKSVVAPMSAEKRTMRFSVLDGSWISRFDWSTWEPYDLQFEISEEALDATRIGDGENSTALFTDAHCDDRRIGKIVDWDIEDEKLYLTCRIGTSEWAERYLQEVEDGVEPGKSVEVFITETQEVEPAEYEGEGWDRRLVKNAKRRAMKYQLCAISTVTTPAIGTVGFSAEEMSKFSEMGIRVQKLSAQVEEFMSKTAVPNPEVVPVELAAEQAPEPVATPAPAVAPVVELKAEQPPVVSSRELLEANGRIEALEIELAQQRSERRRDGISKFLAENSTKLPPAMREFNQKVSSDSGERDMNLSAFLGSLNDPMLLWFQAWVGQCFHAQVPTQPVIPPGEFNTQASNALSAEQLAAKAKKKYAELMAAGTNVTFSQALDQVIAENGVA